MKLFKNLFRKKKSIKSLVKIGHFGMELAIFLTHFFEIDQKAL